ncbi:MAG: DUF4159 domain-containing protein [Longimicrobiales bacterium]
MIRPALFALLAGLSTVSGSGFADSTPAPTRTARSSTRLDQDNTAYNGNFVFVRLRYRIGGGMGGFGRRGRGDAGWAHDYPYAEQNLTNLISNLSTVKPGVIGGNIIDVGDPELHKYPIAYMSEPGYWDMDDQEVANLRAYLLKGGFLIFDDFPYNAWANFEAQMLRILPELEPIQLDATHPIFHSFFEIESLDHLYGSYLSNQPVFLGYFLENDSKQRMLAMVNFQNDLGESWEIQDRGFSFIPEAANEAYKFGINYILYGLTH